MLTVLRAEHWPAFDQSQVGVLERQVLDEAMEVFGEPVEPIHSSGFSAAEAHVLCTLGKQSPIPQFSEEQTGTRAIRVFYHFASDLLHSRLGTVLCFSQGCGQPAGGGSAHARAIGGRDGDARFARHSYMGSGARGGKDGDMGKAGIIG